MSDPFKLGAPALDEIEVSVFGPGRGEAVVVHIGGGLWITIDSCRDERSGAHPVLEYFDQLGVNVATQVVLVVGTHAHDDHTAGIADIYRAAKDAKFVTSSAFTGTEFFSAVVADQAIEDELVHSVRKEYRAIYAEVASRKRSTAPHLLKAFEQKLLYNQRTWEDGPVVRVESLSPSDVAILRSHTAVAEGAARSDSRARLAAPDPNEYTVAVWIEIGDTTILLGGDLLIGPTGSGWKRIAEFHKPSVRASLFKVPHHGSIGAHYEPTWTHLVNDDVVSVLAPYRPSSIPKPRDISRVVERSGAAYVTAKPTAPAPSREVRTTKALLPSFAQNVRERDGRAGQVRARRVHSSPHWDIKTVAPAFRLPQ